jgi:hypothetical protein
MLQMIPIEFFHMEETASKPGPAIAEPTTQSIKESVVEKEDAKSISYDEVTFCKAEEEADLENP